MPSSGKENFYRHIYEFHFVRTTMIMKFRFFFFSISCSSGKNNIQHRINVDSSFLFFLLLYISCLLLAFLFLCVYMCNLFIYLLQGKRKRNLFFFWMHYI